ncbi:hypothetical protein NP945_30610 [Mesorhizobium sp. LMG17149]|uniref:NACHT domain-containing protein n=1 Tax=Mesorhizobium sp. LMG17149 TaxID=2968497 RepID=UPI00211748A0|nr:hypothetical protein [Mesorhizobium sp. LMG17149]MCQ8876199.1 hypothetical protein [Mesorhizobium sp. LMG17149]
MCAIHAKQVDSDEKNFTIPLLRQWKESAENEAYQALTYGRVAPAPIVKLDVDPELLRQLGWSPGDDLEDLIARLHKAAISDLSGFKAGTSWPRHAISLNLQIVGGDGPGFDVAACAAGVDASGELSIVAPPGTGKSTTLVQFASAVLSSERKVAVFVPLNEWSGQSDGILQSLTHRASFRAVREQDFMLLALHGRLVLVLDGWNELDLASRKRAIADIERLRRDFPLLDLAVSTRRQALDVPIAGPRIELQSLSDEQQLEIARAVAGTKGEALLDHAWRISGLRDLVSIPLYLNALLTQVPGGAMPTTKEEVLRLFVTEYERAHTEVLYADLHDFQDQLLVGLAVEATTTSNTAISDTRARTVVSMVGNHLKNEGQWTTPPQPSLALDTLVNHHVLTRPGGKGGVSFQHQQIQEWYASFEAERLMRSVAANDQGAARTLAETIINLPSWGEAILFACERASRADPTGETAIATAVLSALTIDPMLAAEMIHRSSAATWKQIRDHVIDFAMRWHKEGTVDRAARFMIVTGKEEFAQQIWRLIENTDDQVYLQALSLADLFMPSALGSDAAKRLSRLADVPRQHVLSEIASNSGMEGMELAATVASSDPNPQVQVGVIQALQFRRGDRLVSKMLDTAPPEVWSELAAKGYADEVSNPEAVARLRREEHAIAERDLNPRRRLEYLSRTGNGKTDKAISALIASDAFSTNIPEIGWALAEASKHHPNAVVLGLLARLEKGLTIPDGSDELLTEVALVDAGPIAAYVTNLGNPESVSRDSAGIVGPRSLAILIEQLLELRRDVHGSRGRWLESQVDKDRRIRDLLQRSRQDAFVEAWLAQSDTDDPTAIAALSDLIARHGRGTDMEGPPFKKSSQRNVAVALRRHADILLAESEINRSNLAELARAIGRIRSAELIDVLKKLVAKDLTQWRAAQDEFARSHGDRSDAAMDYSRQYCSAFAAIGDDHAVNSLIEFLRDPLFGHQAAVALLQIWLDREGVIPLARSMGGRTFSEVKTRRNEKSNASESTSPFGEAIFAVIQELVQPGCSEREQRQALKLALVATAMPYADKSDLIASLVDLTLPVLSKRELLKSLILAGEMVSADLVLRGIRAYFDEAKEKRWMLNENNQWELNHWLELLPFTNKPATVIEALEVFPSEFRQPWQLRSLISALAEAPDTEAERVLGDLARRDPRFLSKHEWVSALLGKETETAHLLLLDLLCDPQVGGKENKVDSWTVSNKVAGYLSSHPSFRVELIRRYQDPIFAPCHNLIEDILSKSPNENALLAMIHNYAQTGKPLDRRLREAVEEIALERRPVSNWSGAYELHGVAVPGLRKRLFDMTSANDHEGHLAAACLVVIDELRDERGKIDSEPRHPDIQSGRPWPPIPLIFSA